MVCLKTVLLMLVLASLGAGAREAPGSAATPENDKAALPLQPVVPPGRQPVERRSVRQVVEPTPRISGATPSCGPAPAVRAPGAPLPEPLPAPVRLSGCDAGGCNDTSGQRYLGGVGNTLLGPQGQLCTRGAVGAQCF